MQEKVRKCLNVRAFCHTISYMDNTVLKINWEEENAKLKKKTPS
jgi:hypothetical protein